jgi:hypothetical protein
VERPLRGLRFASGEADLLHQADQIAEKLFRYDPAVLVPAGGSFSIGCRERSRRTSSSRLSKKL